MTEHILDQQSNAPAKIDQRLQDLQDWTRSVLNAPVLTLRPLSGDASFRRYFRTEHDGRSIVAVDAPPQRENVRAFLALADGLRTQGVNVPAVLQKNAEQGFWLLQDFGDQLLLPVLNNATVHRLYGAVLDELLRLQRIHTIEGYELPLYDDARLRTELQLFPDWFLTRHAGLELDSDTASMLAGVNTFLVDNALAQPQVLVHRDYHARNLMLLSDSERPGVIDFQDAVLGPVTYDLVSLLKDCYLRWPRGQQLAFVELYIRKAQSAKVLGSDIDREQFIRWFDLMGLQRHLKVLGIFCRLYYRDGKSGYLADLPRVLAYTIEAAGLYAETKALAEFLMQAIAPRLQADGSFAS